MKTSQPKITTTRGKEGYDPIRPVADEIRSDTWLLCFDEFQVSNNVSLKSPS
jgi:predicted ATPase